jgi:hypothetical protein
MRKAMTVSQATEAARSWVIENCGEIADFGGAYTTGSTNWLPADAILPPTSDCDVIVVRESSRADRKTGKFIYGNVILDLSYVSRSQLRPELILGDYHLAAGIQSACILLDSSGELAALQMSVRAQYSKREWVLTRCANARDKVLRYLRSLTERVNPYDRVIAWLFAEGITTHILLTAGLRNPTVRRRYVAVKNLLADYGRLSFHEELLEAIGCRRISQARAARHLAALARVFDAACKTTEMKVPSAQDLNGAARVIAIDGSRDLIEHGCHREAMFWIAVTYVRCWQVLCRRPMPGTPARFSEGYAELLADLGLESPADLRWRCSALENFVPRVWSVVEALIAGNAEVT